VGGIRLVMRDLRTYTLYCAACIITSKCNLGAAAEGDTIGAQQMKRCNRRAASVESGHMRLVLIKDTTDKGVGTLK